MKQRQYTELQKEILKVLERLAFYLDRSVNGLKEIQQIMKDYGIEEPRLTLREYINKYSCGAYHTFYFWLNDKEICIDTIGDMLTDELCSLYPLTNEFYVFTDNTKSYGSDCGNYHCDHYLVLAPKED